MTKTEAGMHHRRAQGRQCVKTTPAGRGRGSLFEACCAGNSNRVLGLFTDLSKGVK